MVKQEGFCRFVRIGECPTGAGQSGNAADTLEIQSVEVVVTSAPANYKSDNGQMTDFDIKLIEKADKLSRWDWRHIGILIQIADTEEARDRLRTIQSDFYNSVMETL